MKSIINLTNVSKKFGNRTLFADVNFAINEGEIVGIVGQNGTGKSVLFKLISGIYRPDSGEIEVNGKKLVVETDFPDNIGILIDSPGFTEIYTGFQNLKYLASIKNKISDETIKEYMTLVGLDPENKTKVKHYSLGMIQKLAIAQAIMEDQQILLLDEPFNALDDKSHEKMIDLIAKLQKDGKTILITSHNKDDLDKLCTKFFIVKDEKIVPYDNK